MQVNKSDGQNSIGPYQQREQKPSKNPEKQLPNPTDLANTTKQNSPPKGATIPEELNQTQQKTNGYASSILNFASYALNYGTNYVGSQMMCRGLKLVEVAVFAVEEIKTSLNQNLIELKELSGNENLGMFLEQFSVPISNTVISNVEGEFLKVGIQNETQFLRSVTKCMTTKMGVNIARQLKAEGKEVTLLTMSAYITTHLKAQLISVQHKLKDVEAIEDPLAKGAEIKKSTNEAVEAFLKLAFPEGEKELPLRNALKGYAWAYLKDTLLPRTFCDLANLGNGIQMMGQVPQADLSAKDISSLREVSHAVETLMVDKGSKLLRDKEFVDALSKIVLSQLGVSKSKETEAFAGWISEQIQLFGDCNHASVSELWKFLGSATGSTVFFVLSNLTKNGEGKHDWKENVFTNVVNTINTFEKLYYPTIEEVYQLQLKKGVKPDAIKTTPEYVQCFVPLSKMIEKIVGFEELGGVFSAKTYGSFEKIVGKNLTTKLALTYDDYLKPFAVVYQAMKNPKAFRSAELDGTEIQMEIEDTVEILAGQLSKYLSGNIKTVEEKICENVLENFPTEEEFKRMVKIADDGVIADVATPLIGKDSPFNTLLHGQVEDLLQKVGVNNLEKKSFFWELFTNGMAGILEHIVLYKKSQNPLLGRLPFFLCVHNADEYLLTSNQIFLEI